MSYDVLVTEISNQGGGDYIEIAVRDAAVANGTVDIAQIRITVYDDANTVQGQERLHTQNYAFGTPRVIMAETGETYTLYAVGIDSNGNSPSFGGGLGSGQSISVFDRSSGTDELVGFYSLGASNVITANTGIANGFTSVDIGQPNNNNQSMQSRDGGRTFESGDEDSGPDRQGRARIPCFCRGTLIQTAAGLRPVQDIQVGDLVQTMDNGLQPVRWVGSRLVEMEDLAEAPGLYPVHLSAGCLGDNMPERDMKLSPQHRVLVRSKVAQRMFGESEVFLPANKLTSIPGIYIDGSVSSVEYFHIMFDQHEIVFADGVASESLYLGPMALRALEEDAKQEIFALFPELERGDTRALARFVPRGMQQKEIVARHVKNSQPMVQNV